MASVNKEWLSDKQLAKMSSDDILTILLPLYSKYTGIMHPYVDNIIDDLWQYEDGYNHVVWHVTHAPRKVRAYIIKLINALVAAKENENTPVKPSYPPGIPGQDYIPLNKVNKNPLPAATNGLGSSQTVLDAKSFILDRTSLGSPIVREEGQIIILK